MIIELAEAASPVEVQMPRIVAIALADADVATIAPGQTDESWWVSGVRRVGALTIADHELRIRPKLPIDRLMFMIGYAPRRRIWRDESITFDLETDLLPAIAQVFLWHLRSAIGKGLLQGYRSLEEAAPTVRGRIDFARQLRRRAGLASPVEVAYDEFTVDIAENRMLASALYRLSRFPGLDTGVLRAVRAYEPTFAGVAISPRGRRLEPVHFDRRNSHYRTSVTLAELILSGASFEHRTGLVPARGFLVDVAAIFEDFVSATLRESLEGMGGTVESQHRAHLDVATRLAIRPDIVWKRNGRIAAVMDAKYKAEKPSGYPHADVYQMLAYCTRFGLTEGHLIYAAGEEMPTVHEIDGADVRVHCHALNLDGGPQDILRRVDRLAERISDLTFDQRKAI